MTEAATDLLTIGAGSIVGLVLGVVGGGGSILAVPLLVYVVGVQSAHVAIGTSALGVALSALSNLVLHWRAGNVKWCCASVFTATGVLGAAFGSRLAQVVDGTRLLSLFGVLMIGVGVSMLLPRRSEGDPHVRISMLNAGRLVPRLAAGGLAVGTLSGFFGIGGGFLIVPGLMLATAMPIGNAVGTSLVSVTGFGATTASSYALAGLIDWRVAALFVAGGLAGSFAGTFIGRRLARHRHALALVFALTVILVGSYVVARAGSPVPA